jgi:hypothetical protein
MHPMLYSTIAIGKVLPAVRPEPVNGPVLGLVQKALFGGRKRRVREHALIMQLGQVVQLR